jgi:hypothetical protein
MRIGPTLMSLFVAFVALPSHGVESSEQPWDCVAGRATPATAKTRLSPSKVSTLAATAAKDQGVGLAKYRQTSICFNDSEQRWAVFFEAAGPEVKLGDHFLVWVREDTQAATLMWGE